MYVLYMRKGEASPSARADSESLALTPFWWHVARHVQRAKRATLLGIYEPTYIMRNTIVHSDSESDLAVC